MTPEERGEKVANLKRTGATGPAAVRLARDIHARFLAKCGATICKDLKGRDTGRVLCECPECYRNAVLAAEEALAEI